MKNSKKKRMDQLSKRAMELIKEDENITSQINTIEKNLGTAEDKDTKLNLLAGQINLLSNRQNIGRRMAKCLKDIEKEEKKNA